MIKRILILIYGVLCYLVFAGTFVYMIGFITGTGVTKSLDSGREGSLAAALLIDILLVILFAMQHSIMARKSFKTKLMIVMPEAMERSTFVLATCLALLSMFILWKPIGGEIWTIDHAAGQMIMHGLFLAGLLLVFISSFSLNHFDLFGLRQAFLYATRKPYTTLHFRIPGVYKYVRHPLYSGFFLVIWCTPTMTASHFVFALAISVYTLIGVKFEEKDLVRLFGKDYLDYQRDVPMIIPGKRKTESMQAVPNE